MMQLSQRVERSELRRRIPWLVLLVILGFGSLAARLVQLQWLDHEHYAAAATENIVRRQSLPTARGLVRDRDGVVLATSRPGYNVYVVPARLDLKGTWPLLVSYLQLDSEQEAAQRQRIEASLERSREWADSQKGAENDASGKGSRRKDVGSDPARRQMLIAEDLSRDVVANIVSHAAELPGVDVVSVQLRSYPESTAAAHLLGYLRELGADELEREPYLDEYQEGDRVGATGIERAWETYLRGTRGWEKVLVDARGRRRELKEQFALDWLSPPTKQDAVPGRDLRLTVDIDLEKAVAKAMKRHAAGAVAVVDVKTGKILALYSAPHFDANVLSGGAPRKQMREAFSKLFDDPLRPMIDKTVGGAYPPGSTFKPFTALAALDAGLVSPTDRATCNGALRFGKRIFRCTHNHGVVDLKRALGESCNVYFYRLAIERGVGMDVIARMADQFGFGEKTGIGINAETAGRVPTRAWMTLQNNGQYRLGFNLNAAIGQGATTVSVLQLALAYGALANGGVLYAPQLVQSVETASGTVVQEFEPRVRHVIPVSAQHLSLIREGLVSGVRDEEGTAYRARIKGIDLAGKTGTAQVSHHVNRGVDTDKVWYFNREHAWFAGYAPSADPEIAIAVLVEHGGAGGKVAAPIAFEVTKAYFELKQSALGSGARVGGAR
jgi:penicillin-binding protein 2